MIQIPYEAFAFPRRYGAKLVGPHLLSATWADLALAAITVGKPGQKYLSMYGAQSLFEIIYKTFMIKAHLIHGPGGILTRSSLYDSLDPSEKGAVSYFIGLTSAKLLSEKLLRVPWLMHLDVYRHRLKPYSYLRGHRPDLVGELPNRRWIVIEAKGRTNSYSGTLVRKAKLQARSLTRIQGTRPALTLASIAHFGQGHLSIYWEDPSPPPGDSSLEISRKEFLDEYYKSAISLIASRINDTEISRFFNKRIRILEIPSADLVLGLESQLLRDPDIERAAEAVAQKGEAISRGSEKLGIDGIYLKLGQSWSEHSMSQSPEDRGSL